jgi:hypothetical protein
VDRAGHGLSLLGCEFQTMVGRVALAHGDISGGSAEVMGRHCSVSER